MSNNYTKNTASLKANRITAGTIDSKKLFIYAEEGKDDSRKNILDILKDLKESIEILDERGNDVTENDIWGRYVKNEDGVNVIHNKWLNATVDESLKTLVTKIEHNKAYDDNGQMTFNVEVDKIKSAVCSFAMPNLTSFSGDLRQLEDGTEAFRGSSIEVIDCDFSSLKNARGMFKDSSLKRFDKEVTLVNIGSEMFRNTKNMTYFDSPLNNLLDGGEMFEGSSIKRFSSYVPYLYNGKDMFRNSNIEDINASFTNLFDGIGMFENTNLNLESIRKIAETLPKINHYNYDEYGGRIYTWANGTTINFTISEWSDEKEDMIPLAQTLSISPNTIGEIMITWKDVTSISKEDKAIIIHEYFKLMTLKGWTVITNLTEEDTSDIYCRAISTNDSLNATHVDSEGKYYKVYIGTTVHYPVTGFAKKKWKRYSSVNDMESDLNFTPIP